MIPYKDSTRVYVECPSLFSFLDSKRGFESRFGLGRQLDTRQPLL
ncbi:hypothetical protein HSB1_39920 [Halogranum salarium B-1]|uniref:Uncharacterized protein n=1 Tax=Halogranum salarium B-1 TaxID=1210908 RepID=J3JDN0_9EURY|nr:hypothetical protein HSB1_39920 [Halogranum salarium B-1]